MAVTRDRPVCCMKDTGSKVTIMGYAFHQQHYEQYQTLDFLPMAMEAANKLPLPVEGVAWLRIQMVICSSAFPKVPVLLGMNVSK